MYPYALYGCVVLTRTTILDLKEVFSPPLTFVPENVFSGTGPEGIDRFVFYPSQFHLACFLYYYFLFMLSLSKNSFFPVFKEPALIASGVFCTAFAGVFLKSECKGTHFF